MAAATDVFQLGHDWPLRARNYTPHLDHASKIKDALQKFEEDMLSQETAVKLLVATESSTKERLEFQSRSMDFDQLIEHFMPGAFPRFSHHMLFVNRHLVRHRTDPLPADPNKLRLSRSALEFLIDRLELTPAFVFALSRYYLPTGRGFRPSRDLHNSPAHDFWCFLPVRIQVKCMNQGKNHALSTAGSNQMDPFYYLHFPDAEVDIRGSQIALYTRFNSEHKPSFTLAINLFDGRWKTVVEQPQKRIQECAKVNYMHSSSIATDPFLVHIIYLTSVLEWWINTLGSFNNQLIAHEKALQHEQDTAEEVSSTGLTERNRALHSMAAHLHRYSSELQSLEDTILEIQARDSLFTLAANSSNGAAGGEVDIQTMRTGTQLSLQEIQSQLKNIKGLRSELDSKIQNILALLFNRIQITTDKKMVDNTYAMQKILEAQQEETKLARKVAIQSQRLAESMQEDSLAMKTIAVVTMFFLPGTSFAALLAMPFFSQNKWFNNTRRIWLWLALTVPSTLLAFFFYFWLRNNRDHRRRRRRGRKIIMSPAGKELDDDEEEQIGHNNHVPMVNLDINTT